MGRLRERTQYLKIKRKSYRLLKDFVRVLLREFNSVRLKKEKNRDEKEFKISGEVFSKTFFIYLSVSGSTISSSFNLKIF
jgi:hypothetical protein